MMNTMKTKKNAGIGENGAESEKKTQGRYIPLLFNYSPFVNGDFCVSRRAFWISGIPGV